MFDSKDQFERTDEKVCFQTDHFMCLFRLDSVVCEHDFVTLTSNFLIRI